MARCCQPVTSLPGERHQSRVGSCHPGQGPTVPGRVPPSRPSPGGGGGGRAGPGSPPAAPWLAAGTVPEGSGRRRRGAAGESRSRSRSRPAGAHGGTAPPRPDGRRGRPACHRPRFRGTRSSVGARPGRWELWGGGGSCRSRGTPGTHPPPRPPRPPAMRGTNVAPRGPHARRGGSTPPPPAAAAPPFPSSNSPLLTPCSPRHGPETHTHTPSPRHHRPPHGSRGFGVGQSPAGAGGKHPVLGMAAGGSGQPPPQPPACIQQQSPRPH